MQEEEEMTRFGNDPVQSPNEALAYARGEGPATVHTPAAPARGPQAGEAQAGPDGAPDGMSLSGCRKRERGTRRVSGPAAALLRAMQKEPEAVRRALAADG